MLHLFFDLSAAFAVEPPSGEAPVIVDGTGEPPPEWVHILPTPDANGFIQSRDFRIVKVNDLVELATRSNAAVKRQKGGQPVDADHELYGWWKSGGPVKAWAEEFEARADGLYARVDWLKAGADLVTSREYGYTSSVIDGPAEWTYDEDGWPTTLTIEADAIVGFGLTNIPALETHRMFNTQSNAKEIETLRVMARKLGISDDATPEQMRERFRRFNATESTPAAEQFAAVEKDPTFKVDDKVKIVADHMPELKGMVVPIATIGSEPYYSVKLPDGSVHKWYAESELEAADDQPLDSEMPGGGDMSSADKETVEVLSKKLAAAERRVADLESEAAQQYIAQLCRDGKMTPAQKKAALALAEKPGGLDGLRALYSNAPRVVDGNRPQVDVADLATDTAPRGVDPLAYRLAGDSSLSITDITEQLKRRNQEKPR